MTVTDWVVVLIGALGRLLIALSDCGEPCDAVQDCAVELADDLNNFAYLIERPKD